jgi:hypothetical protein
MMERTRYDHGCLRRFPVEKGRDDDDTTFDGEIRDAKDGSS